MHTHTHIDTLISDEREMPNQETLPAFLLPHAADTNRNPSFVLPRMVSRKPSFILPHAWQSANYWHVAPKVSI